MRCDECGRGWLVAERLPTPPCSRGRLRFDDGCRWTSRNGLKQNTCTNESLLRLGDQKWTSAVSSEGSGAESLAAGILCNLRSFILRCPCRWAWRLPTEPAGAEGYLRAATLCSQKPTTGMDLIIIIIIVAVILLSLLHARIVNICKLNLWLHVGLHRDQ